MSSVQSKLLDTWRSRIRGPRPGEKSVKRNSCAFLMIVPKDFSFVGIFLLALVCMKLVTASLGLCLLWPDTPISITSGVPACSPLPDLRQAFFLSMSLCHSSSFFCLFLIGPTRFLGQFYLLLYLQLKIYSE